MSWPLPPDLEWPRFLRLLRRPDPPKGWLEAAATLPDLRKRPMLLRWIAQHAKCPAHLRAQLIPRLPSLPLASVANDPAAHPQARAMATERLQVLWQGISTGERRSLALRLPRRLWPLAWRVPDAGVIHNLVRNPRMSVELLVGLAQPPLTRAQEEALARSPYAEAPPVAAQVLEAMDRAFGLPECPWVLGHAAPWIKRLEPGDRLVAAARLRHPPLRRMCRAWALPAPADGDGG